MFTEPTSTNLPSFIKNAGYNDPNNGEASLLYISTGQSYGESTNIVIDCTMGVTTSTTYFYAPTNAPNTSVTIESTQDWTQGMKWLMCESENMLGNSGNPTAFLSQWSPALIKSSANGSIPHMILGTRLGGFSHLTTDILGVLTTFFQYGTNGSVADAWVIHAGVVGYGINNNPFSALMHYDNKDDTLTNPTPDSADRTMRYLYWSSGSISTSYIAWNLPVVNLQDYRLVSKGKTILPTKPYLIPETLPEKYFKLDYKPEELEEALYMSDKEAEHLAREILRKQSGGVPQDMALVDVGNVMVGLFDGEHIKDTYHEFVKAKQLTFAHVKNGQQIYANGKPDYIRVFINAHGVKLVERQWHKLVMR